MKIQEFERLKQESVGHMLIKAARVYNEYAFQTVKEKMNYSKLRPSHLQLFAHIPFEGITVIELSKKLNISKQAVSKLIQELLEEKVLIKKDNPEDARSYLITFKTGNKSALFQGMQELAKLDAEIELLLGKQKSKELKTMLQSIINKFD